MITIRSYQGFPESFFSKSELIRWLTQCAIRHGFEVDRLSIVFCDRETMIRYNREFLQHDYETDIITFPESEITKGDQLRADILINADIIPPQAQDFGQTLEKETLRLLAHGLLHLCGFGDKTDEQMIEMRKAEDQWIGYFEETGR